MKIAFIASALAAVALSAAPASADPILYTIAPSQILSDGGAISGDFTFDVTDDSFAGAFDIETGPGSGKHAITTTQIYDSTIGCLGGATTAGELSCAVGTPSAFVELTLSPLVGSGEFPIVEANGGFSEFRFGDGPSESLDATAAVAAVPEPASIMLLGTGLLGFAAQLRRRLRAN